MPCSHTLFHKKSKGSLRHKPSIEERFFSHHSRTLSTSSTLSATSTATTRSHIKIVSYDPLSLHPPMSLNTSPTISETEENDFQRNQIQHDTVEHDPNKSDDSALDIIDFYYNHDPRRKTYVYEQRLQWPLKDWQTVPSSFPDMSTLDDFRRHTTPPPTTQPRPRKEDKNDVDTFVQRGEWKRRGIVFELDSEDEAEQAKHFEVNPFELAA